MDPIANTAWYCCAARAADARRPQPICGDVLAERFMVGPAKPDMDHLFEQEGSHVAVAMRHRLVDDALRDALGRDARQRVVLLGAGFDTRPFRLSGGRWMELDRPALVALKEETLPSTRSPNPLVRVAIDFDRESLADPLVPWAGQPAVVVVMEGVSMYLQPAQWLRTTRTLRRLLPGHLLVCDLLDATFLRRHGRRLRRALRGIGGDFASPAKDPAAMVCALGYRQRAAWSIVGSAVEAGALSVPRWLPKPFGRSLRDGYRVCVFEAT